MFDKVINSLKAKTKAKEKTDSGGILNESIPSEWRPGDVILDRYRIDQVFSGAMGRVYISEHLGWKVPLAIKAPRPEILADKEGLQRILTEANSWVRMGMHPNVATCYYVLNIDSTPYLFIEYVDGGDLSSWLKTGRCKDQRTLLSMAVQFCHGMEFTHSKGIIHRDIKPGNILLTKNALLKITDFGIVQTTARRQKDTPLTDASSEETIGFRGTPSYASPEQFRNTHSVDLRSDIFSFGICLWLMFCGRRPFKNNAIPGKATPTPVDPKTPFPKVLQELLIKSVAHDPSDRFQTFSELREALNEAHIVLFRVPCPFMELDFSDLQAENLNNRAISFIELGKKKEGKKYLQRALDENDTLPEAIFNLSLFKWQEGLSPSTLYKQVEASRKRFPKAKMLDTLTQALKCDLNKEIWDIPEHDLDIDTPPSPPQKTYFPEYLFCLPKNSLDIFQSSQLTRTAKENMNDLLEKKKYAECHEILFKVWGNKNFKNDHEYKKIYEKLLTVGSKKKLAAVIRLKTLRNCSIPTQKLLYLPEKQKIFALCRDGKIIIHAPNKPGEISILGHYKSVCTATLSPDSQLLALGLKEGIIEILSLNSGKTEAKFAVQGVITAIALNAGNTNIAAGFSDGNIKVFSLVTKKESVLSAKEGGGITALACFNRSDDFISGSEDGTLRYWSINQSTPIRIVNAHSKGIKVLSPSDNGLFFLSAADDKYLKIWDRQTGQCKKSMNINENKVNTALVLPGSTHFVSAGKSDIISVWQPSHDKPEFLLDGRGDGITYLAPGPFPHIFLAGCQDGSIIIWMLVYELEFP